MPVQKLLAKIHIAKKQLGIEDDEYRDILQNATGKRSSALMDEREIIKAIRALLATYRDPYKPSPEMLWKIEHDWDEYHHYCKCGDSKGHQRRFLFSRIKISDINLLDRRKAYEFEEALKAMIKREYARHGHGYGS